VSDGDAVGPGTERKLTEQDGPGLGLIREAIPPDARRRTALAGHGMRK
jgi:hypothetical protein